MDGDTPGGFARNASRRRCPADSTAAITERADSVGADSSAADCPGTDSARAGADHPNSGHSSAVARGDAAR